MKTIKNDGVGTTLGAEIDKVNENFVELKNGELDINIRMNAINAASPVLTDWVQNSSYVNSAVIMQYDGMVRSDPFEVIGGKTYIYRGYSPAGPLNVIEYDINDVVLTKNYSIMGIDDGQPHDTEIMLQESTVKVALSGDKTIFDRYGIFFILKANQTFPDLAKKISENETRIVSAESKITVSQAIITSIEDTLRNTVYDATFEEISLPYINGSYYSVNAQVFYRTESELTYVKATDLIELDDNFDYLFSTPASIHPIATITLIAADGITKLYASYAEFVNQSIRALANNVKYVAIGYYNENSNFSAGQSLKRISYVEKQTYNKSKINTLLGIKDIVINFLGDSITEYGMIPGFTDGWIHRIADYFGIDFDTNVGKYGIGGTRLSLPASGIDPTAMVVRYADMRDDADIIVVMGGSNDFAQGYVLGDLTQLTTLSPDAKTIAGAMRIIIEGIYTKYANRNIKLVWGIFPQKMTFSNNIDHSGVAKSDWDLGRDLIISVLKYYGIPYFNLYDESGINVFNCRPHPNILPSVTFPTNGYLLSNGLINTGDTTYHTSGFIEITPGEYTASINCMVAFYTSNSDDSYIPNSYQYYYDGAVAVAIFKAPANAAYMRISISSSSNDIYFTKAAGTMMTDSVHPSANAQKFIYDLAIQKIR